MDPLTRTVSVAKPAAEVFEYLADVANHPEFLDHFTSEWHLTREDSYGLGAGVSYRVNMRGNRFPWVDQTIVRCDPPRLLVLAGQAGKYNRIHTVSTYELDSRSDGTTELSVRFETTLKYPSDRLFDRGAFYRRRLDRGLRRLRSILENGDDRGLRATIAGGARKPATGTPLR